MRRIRSIAVGAILGVITVGAITAAILAGASDPKSAIWIWVKRLSWSAVVIGLPIGI